MDLFFGLVALFFLFLNFFTTFNFFKFIIIIFIFYFNNFILFYFIYLFFCLAFLLSHVADGVLVLWLGVRPEPLRWETRVQDIGPPETSLPQEIPKHESSPRDLHLNAKIQLYSTTSKLQCWTPYAK